jgi:GMP synthase (glutamine-hydrolysing)
MIPSHETIILLDFGAQYTQLIARRVREAHVYCEILPFNTPVQAVLRRHPKGVILSGGPASVYGEGAPHSDKSLWDAKLPVLGICYGFQLLAYQLGGKVEAARKREYGLAELELHKPSLLFDGVPQRSKVWMSHGDHIADLPRGFEPVGLSENSLAAAEDTQRKIFGLQFHPEVAHTEQGRVIIEDFLFKACGCKGDRPAPDLYLRQ